MHYRLDTWYWFTQSSSRDYKKRHLLRKERTFGRIGFCYHTPLVWVFLANGHTNNSCCSSAHNTVIWSSTIFHQRMYLFRPFAKWMNWKNCLHVIWLIYFDKLKLSDAICTRIAISSLSIFMSCLLCISVYGRGRHSIVVLHQILSMAAPFISLLKHSFEYLITVFTFLFLFVFHALDCSLPWMYFFSSSFSSSFWQNDETKSVREITIHYDQITLHHDMTQTIKYTVYFALELCIHFAYFHSVHSLYLSLALFSWGKENSFLTTIHN